MTIVADVRAAPLPWRGHDDPRLPVGVWFASGTVVGDASGGTMQVRFVFSAEGEPVSGDLFNVEQMSCLVSSNTGRDGFFIAQGLSPSPANVFDRRWSLKIDPMGSLSGNGGLRDGYPRFPIFLGTKRGGADTFAALSVGLNNLTATDSLSVSVMGYRWGTRSILAPGGPQRPPAGLWN